MPLTKQTTVRVTLVVEIGVTNNFFTETVTLEEAFKAAREEGLRRAMTLGGGVRVVSSRLEAVIVATDERREA